MLPIYDVLWRDSIPSYLWEDPAKNVLPLTKDNHCRSKEEINLATT